jgi:hypothetical protein
LLALARELSALPRTAELHAAVAALAAAYAPEGSLVAALRQESSRAPADKTARLALGWAREQVRLALVDVLHRARGARQLRAEGEVETLAWLWLAACEALVHEPTTAVPDRVHTLRVFLAGA